LTGRRAAAIRARIAATVTRRAAQVMVKMTGGGRGMGAIAAHFRYISKNGRLEIEDDRGSTRKRQEALHDLVKQWRYGGSLIGEVSHRREAFNIMLAAVLLHAMRRLDGAALFHAPKHGQDVHGTGRVHGLQADPRKHVDFQAPQDLGQEKSPRALILEGFLDIRGLRWKSWNKGLVETRRIELLTFALRTRRSPS
jgi:hypothetical protein